MYSTCTTSVLPQGFHGLTCLPGQCRMTTGQWFHWRPRRRNHSEDGAKPLPGLLMRHLIINWQPVRCDLDLGLFQRYRPGANLAVQVVFDAIFLVEAWRGAGSLGPEIRDIIRAAQLQANEMIDLVLARQVACYSILSV